MKKILSLFVIGATIVSCVPARKYEELKAKQEDCADEVLKLKSMNTDLETKNTELEEEIPELKEDIVKLTGEKDFLEKSLKVKEEQYDKINDLNKMIQEQLEMLRKSGASENAKLLADLNATKIELQAKEDALKQLELELNAKKAELNAKQTELDSKQIALDKLSNDLKEREKRVNELENLIAKKDEVVNALKDKVAQALLGFKDKGLSVVQKNGKVYVSMEAKLLFASGSTNIDPEGKKALIELAKVLQDQTDLEILVEGHTDTDAFTSSHHPSDNWELSVLRATSVVKIMLANSSMSSTTITAAGRSEYIPVDINDKAKNRRIEVILIPKLDELFEIIGQ